MAVLVFNVGSSSLRAAAFRMRRTGPEKVLTADHDASAGDSAVTVRCGGQTQRLDVQGSDYAQAATGLIALAEEALEDVVVVGHRVVHGETLSGAPVRLGREALERLGRFAALAPLHQKANLMLPEAVRRERPGLVQYASFDTSFHTTIPDRARELPLPPAMRGPLLRRYGFHGLSFRSVARRMAGRGAPRVVALHLGGGASVCAMQDDASIDTTMGVTPLAGSLMTTRSGSIDPGALLYLLQREDGTASELAEMLWQDSGLRALSGQSGDLRDLIGAEDARAQTAVAQFCDDLVRYTGAMLARLGGMDALVFTGGAGIGQPVVRARVAAAFGFAGVTLDPACNAAVTERSVPEEGACISSADSRAQVWVLPVGEEDEIARDSHDII